MGKVYSLTVGINEYDDSPLDGCVTDATNFDQYLKDTFGSNLVSPQLVLDEDATRDHIIKLFREYLRRAGSDDVAVFHFSGHGAQSFAAKEFLPWFPDGMDEGLVCFDSRQKKKFDLADKELAVLLHEVATLNEKGKRKSKAPHIAVILDSCHSGSATRSVDDFKGLKARFTRGNKEPRPLETYLDGFYKKQLKGKKVEAGKKRPPIIPTAPHILIAACNNKQTAKEDWDGGIFSLALMSTLENRAKRLSYKQLFERCRAAVLASDVEDQTPQFETYGNFNGNSGFLGGEATGSTRIIVDFDKGNTQKWVLQCGSAYGLPNDPDKQVQVQLFEPGGKKPIGTARTSAIGSVKSPLELDDGFTLGHEKPFYLAEITSMPVAPTPVYFEGPEAAKNAIEAASTMPSEPTEDDLIKFVPVNAIFVDTPTGCKYGIFGDEQNRKFQLRDLENDFILTEATLVDRQGNFKSNRAKTILNVLHAALHWERIVALENPHTQMDIGSVDFAIVGQSDGKDINIEGDAEVTLDYKGKSIAIDFEVTNNSHQELHFLLLHCGGINHPSDSDHTFGFGISEIINQKYPANGKTAKIFKDSAPWKIWLSNNDDQNTDTYKLIVSTERLDKWFFEQKELQLVGKKTKAGGRQAPEDKKHTAEWFTKTITVNLVKAPDKISASDDLQLADNAITIKANKAIKANAGMSAAKPGTRSLTGSPGMLRFLQKNGMELPKFKKGTRATTPNQGNMLELHNIESDGDLNEQLAKHPIEIDIKSNLKENEILLPIIFDGENALIGGDFSKDDKGNTRVSINHIPPIKDKTRSLGKALKLYFMKAYLDSDNVDKLSWVDYKRKNGKTKATRNNRDVAAKVKKARNILLLIHGIIGDTGVIAEGVAAGAKPVKGNFDLVLTYDYENLNRPIEDSALELKRLLKMAGLSESDNKRLTIIAHSMGGLVSRWFIEKEGGNKFVDHLVMCGTPNGGSPFGKIDTARKIFKGLTTLAMSTFPIFAPAGGFILSLLFRSSKITHTLEQMNPSSNFMRTLETANDPEVPYTILAGNISQFDDPDGAVGKLINKVGRSNATNALFGTKEHDIAVSLDSIKDVPAPRKPKPAKHDLECHHLNYFNSTAGLKALQSIKW